MENFASIGKAVVIQSLGLQKNYVEIATSQRTVTDYNNTECQQCKYHALLESFSKDSEAYKSALKCCDSCPKRVTTTEPIYEKIYHNEKNVYGYKPRLKSNAIKLLLLLHFYHPDRYGIVKSVSIEDLAAELECNIRTISNNLLTLQEYGYIDYCRISSKLITVNLIDYEKYFLSASQGGRGFFVMSKELLKQIINIDTLLSLRIHLREIIEFDNLSTKTDFSAVSKTFKDIKNTLPDYCKPCNIRSAIADKSSIFDITFKENVIRFEIREKYNSRKQKENLYNNFRAILDEFVVNFNNSVFARNTNNFINDELDEFFSVDESDSKNGLHEILSSGGFKPLYFKDYQLDDLASLSVSYSYENVLAALSIIYKTYILPEKNIDNLGGLTRTILKSLIKSNNSSLAA